MLPRTGIKPLITHIFYLGDDKAHINKRNISFIPAVELIEDISSAELHTNRMDAKSIRQYHAVAVSFRLPVGSFRMNHERWSTRFAPYFHIISCIRIVLHSWVFESSRHNRLLLLISVFIKMICVATHQPYRAHEFRDIN